MPKMTDLMLGQIDLELTRRDYEVLKMLRQFRFMRTDQIKRLFMRKHEGSERAKLSATTRLLHRLMNHGLISHLPRKNKPVGGGSYGLVWYLSESGMRLFDLREGTAKRRHRPHDPSPKYLQHTLAVVETFVVYAETVWAAGGALTPERIEVEKEAIREFKIDGKKSRIWPDLFIQVKAEEERYFFYIEVDLGTEGASEVLTKCKRYWDYCRTGKAKTEHGCFPLVLWLVPNSMRKEWMMKAIMRGLTKKQQWPFAVATADEFPKVIRSDKYWNEVVLVKVG